MVTKNFIKTIVSGLLTRIQMHEISEEELLTLFDEMNLVHPLINNDGSVYVNNTGKIYIL